MNKKDMNKSLLIFSVFLFIAAQYAAAAFKKWGVPYVRDLFAWWYPLCVHVSIVLSTPILLARAALKEVFDDDVNNSLFQAMLICVFVLFSATYACWFCGV